MSSHRYTNSTNPFDEDDIDDETFLAGAHRTPSATSSSNLEEQMASLQHRRTAIEDRTIASTERSIGILRDSEQIGIATAEELARQRDQLERTDRRLDEINQTLRFSQKHINGIKSVFSSLKNYVAGRKETTSSPANTPSTTRATEITTYDKFDSHPVTRLKNLPTSEVKPATINARMEANLGEMSSTISRLKHLATDLGGEIDAQNDLIEGITCKSETAELSIRKQNTEMNRLLGKK